ncbi:P-loop containing nucleoside triphosphate hydrolase protein [Gongronella butleri]|nr:P-loop containing nucleoside triphosphate hydrolase protein [Gongronella butleri]
MVLEVIGAGFGRTGTYSLYKALEELGYTTHHMSVLVGDPTQDATKWSRAYKKEDFAPEEWHEVYKTWTAAVDWPTCEFYKELSEVYPNAKVILTVRSPESWYKSMCNTIFKLYHKRLDENYAYEGHMGSVSKMLVDIALDGALLDHDRMSDEKYICSLFQKHVDEVIRTIPADRLLVLELGSGWEPLCSFLGKPVPDKPYPRTNSSDEFQTTRKLAHDRCTAALAAKEAAATEAQ